MLALIQYRIGLRPVDAGGLRIRTDWGLRVQKVDPTSSFQLMRAMAG